jgi:hypothetical protein
MSVGVTPSQAKTCVLTLFPLRARARELWRNTCVGVCRCDGLSALGGRHVYIFLRFCIGFADSKTPRSVGDLCRPVTLGRLSKVRFAAFTLPEPVDLLFGFDDSGPDFNDLRPDFNDSCPGVGSLRGHQ